MVCENIFFYQSLIFFDQRIVFLTQILLYQLLNLFYSFLAFNPKGRQHFQRTVISVDFMLVSQQFNILIDRNFVLLDVSQNTLIGELYTLVRQSFGQNVVSELVLKQDIEMLDSVFENFSRHKSL